MSSTIDRAKVKARHEAHRARGKAAHEAHRAREKARHEVDRAKDAARHEMDRARGKAKEIAGRMTGDERLEAEGRTDRFRAELRKAWRGLGRRARGVRDSFRKGRS
ncbi:CsbD family protein [Streptomyces omiyaensis]|uniref:Uncharacterized protein n=1 Tax=Streptomyces omiyaensis TaxID=68247 RepID=A0ABW7BWI5_9ACTN